MRTLSYPSRRPLSRGTTRRTGRDFEEAAPQDPFHDYRTGAAEKPNAPTKETEIIFWGCEDWLAVVCRRCLSVRSMYVLRSAMQN